MKIKRIVMTFLGMGIAFIALIQTVECKRYKRENKKLEDDLNKWQEFYFLQNQWIYLLHCGKGIKEYMVENDCKTVAIYGMRELGESLYEELKNSGIDVKYAIDRNADNITSEINILKPTDDLPTVDLIIVTAIHYFDEIEKELRNKGFECMIVSLEDIVYEI